MKLFLGKMLFIWLDDFYIPLLQLFSSSKVCLMLIFKRRKNDDYLQHKLKPNIAMDEESKEPDRELRSLHCGFDPRPQQQFFHPQMQNIQPDTLIQVDRNLQ